MKKLLQATAALGMILAASTQTLSAQAIPRDEYLRYMPLEYIRLTDRHYRLLGRTDRLSLSFSSAEPVEEFVGRGTGVLDLAILK